MAKKKPAAPLPSNISEYADKMESAFHHRKLVSPAELGKACGKPETAAQAALEQMKGGKMVEKKGKCYRLKPAARARIRECFGR